VNAGRRSYRDFPVLRSRLPKHLTHPSTPDICLFFMTKRLSNPEQVDPALAPKACRAHSRILAADLNPVGRSGKASRLEIWIAAPEWDADQDGVLRFMAIGGRPVYRHPMLTAEDRDGCSGFSEGSERERGIRRGLWADSERQRRGRSYMRRGYQRSGPQKPGRGNAVTNNRLCETTISAQSRRLERQHRSAAALRSPRSRDAPRCGHRQTVPPAAIASASPSGFAARQT